MNALVAALLGVGLLASCASSTSGVWTKPGAEGPRTVVDQDWYRRCMTERGSGPGPAK